MEFGWGGEKDYPFPGVETRGNNKKNLAGGAFFTAQPNGNKGPEKKFGSIWGGFRLVPFPRKNAP